MSARVLVVDDVEINVKLLEAKLASEYFHVITASDGMAALTQVKRERPDIVLLDIMMALFARVRSLVRLKRMTDEWRLREETYGRLAALADGEAKTSEDTRPARIIVFEDRPLSAQRILDTLTAHTVTHAVRSDEVQIAAATGADLLVLALSEQEDTLRLVAGLR